MRTASSASSLSESEGLMVHDHTLGMKTLVMPSQDIADDILATFSKLQDVVEQITSENGSRWKQRRPKNGVNLFELEPSSGNDADVAHAFLATAELKCHVNEVLSVLVHQDSEEMDATVKSLGGRKVRSGGIYYQQLHPLESQLVNDVNTQPNAALFGVQTVVVRPKFSVKRHSKLRTGFSTCTIRFPKRDRAYHLMKTLPKSVHSRVVSESESGVLEGKHDHVAIGWDIRMANQVEYGSGNHTTRVIAHAYISTVPPSEFGRLHPASFSSTTLAQHRKSYSHPDAERVASVITKSLCEFETVIRRRRLGFQTFVSHAKEEFVDSPICLICRVKFSLFRRDYFCRLCGHVVCGDCSGMYDVEAPIGRVRKHRYCIACIRRVDACHFDDEDLVPALGPVLVDTPAADWESNVPLSESLLQNDRDSRSMALDSLDRLFQQDSFRVTSTTDEPSRDSVSSTRASPISVLKPTGQQVVEDFDQHLTNHLNAVKDLCRADECPVYASERDHAFEFDEHTMTNPDIPIPPQRDADKEARRRRAMQTSGVLLKDYDHAALDLISEVAAKRLNCSIGLVGMLGDNQYHAIGKYQFGQYGLPDIEIPTAENCCVYTTYAERPMIVKNVQRDVRFAQMGLYRDHGIKFYAGFPVCAPDGTVLATLCALDVEPHDNIGTKEYATMQMLSELAAKLILSDDEAEESMQCF